MFLKFSELNDLNTFIIGISDAANPVMAVSHFIAAISEEFGVKAADDVLSKGFRRRAVSLVNTINPSTEWELQISDYVTERLKGFQAHSTTEYAWTGKDRYLFWGVTVFERKKGVCRPPAAPEVI